MTGTKPPAAGGVAQVGPWSQVRGCRTLFEVHQVVVAQRPPSGADRDRWVVYHRRAASAYELIAEIDRGHHHEARYWAQRECRMGDALAGGTADVGEETGRT